MVAYAIARRVLSVRGCGLGFCEETLNEAVKNSLYAAVAGSVIQSVNLSLVIVFSLEERENKSLDKSGDISYNAEVKSRNSGRSNAEVNLAGADDSLNYAGVISENFKKLIDNLKLSNALTGHARLPAVKIEVADNTEHPSDHTNQYVV